MRLIKICIENFRCYAAPISVRFDDLTALVGRNDVGKSSIMDALAIFFEVAKPDKDDACKTGDAANMRITCTFAGLQEVILDSEYQTTLVSEYLLNGEGHLEIRKTYNGGLATPKMTAVEALAMHPSAQGRHDLLTLKRAELIARASELEVDLTTVNKNANAPIRAAIWASCDDLSLAPSWVPLESEGGKQIWTALSPFLPTFALFKSDRASTDQDSEAQDPLKAAIREAVKAVEGKLQEVKDHVETEVRKIAQATVQKLREMDPSVADTLDPVITTKSWETLFQTSITGDDGIPLNKRGSGVKRLVLLNFFRAKAERAAHEVNGDSIIYAVEEPETSQHPRNQRLLLNALRELAAGEGKQVIVTTHTPMLARCLPDTSLRFVERAEDGSRTIIEGDEATSARIAQSLGVLPDHTVKLFIGVEGPHDIEFLKGMARMLRHGGEDAPDLDALELDGEIIFFPFGGSNLALWASRLHALNRPEFHLCDRDLEPPAEPKYAGYMAEVNARAGCEAVATTKREMENYLHPIAICEAYQANGMALALPEAFADFDDVPAQVAQAVHLSGGGELEWQALGEVRQKEKVRVAKRQLNGQVLTRMTPARLTECDATNEVRGWLGRIAQMMAANQ